VSHFTRGRIRSGGEKLSHVHLEQFRSRKTGQSFYRTVYGSDVTVEIESEHNVVGVLDKLAVPLFGDLLPNVATGKRVLSSDQSEVLCLKVSLPAAATDQTMAATTATLTFTAEQTGNQT
jgi:hypothetical protein